MEKEPEYIEVSRKRIQEHLQKLADVDKHKK